MIPLVDQSPLARFFHPVLPARKLRRAPVRVEVAGRAFALFRDASGRARGVADRCPHRFAPLSKGTVDAKGRIVCPYHGWAFDGEGRGASPSQPELTKCDVGAIEVVERDAYLWIGERTAARMRDFAVDASGTRDPAWDGYRFCGAFAVRFDAPLHVAFDNFSEDEHTPFVHTRLGWEARDAGAIGFTAENHADRTVVHYHAKQRPSRIAQLFGIRPGDVFHNDWVTRFDPVHTVYTTQWRDPHTDAVRPMSIKSPIYFVPETERTTWLHTFVFARLTEPLLDRMFPLLRHVATAVAWGEIRDDARFIPTVKNTPKDLRGMRLGKYDKPIIHNHKLLQRLYWGLGETGVTADA